MSKKKAIKLAAASAVAASAFVAAAPAQTDAASNVKTEVSKAVTQMKKAYHTYSDVTNTGDFADIDAVYAQYNTAKKAYNSAKALVNSSKDAAKDAYLAQLDSTYKEYIAKRVVTYIDAFNYAVELAFLQEDLEAALVAKDWDAAEELYHAISYELKTRTVILDRVYGASTRELLKETFKADAQAARDSIANEVTVKIATEKASELVTAGKLVEAKAQLDKAAAAAAKMDKDADFGKALLVKHAEVVAAYEAKVAPAVLDVTAINAKKLEVKFNKAVTKASAENSSNYSFVGLGTVTATGYELQADGKTVVVTLSGAIANDTTFVATVSEITTAASADVKTSKFSKTMTFSDNVRPAFTNVTYSKPGVAELNFSEELSTEGTVVVYDGLVASTSVTKTLNGSTLTLGALGLNKEYRVVITGAKDQSGNLIATPIEVTVKNTASDTVKPVATSITSQGIDTLKIQFSEALVATSGVYANVKVDGVAASGTLNQTFDTKTNILTISGITGISNQAVKSITIDGFKDAANLTGDAVTRVISFTTAAPALQTTTVVTEGGKTFAVLTFDKAVSAIDSTFTASYVTADNVYKTTSLPATVDVNKKQVKLEVTGKEAGAYTVVFNAGKLSDGVTSNSKNVEVKFNVGTTVDSSTPEVSALYLANDILPDGTKVAAGTAYVKYSKPMSASALNADNYKVDGSSVFSNPIFVGDKTLVKLTIKSGAVTVTGDRNFSVSTDVKGENNVAIKPFTIVDRFTENVNPVLTSATLLDASTIELSLSELLGSTGFAAADAAKSFEVTVGGTKNVVSSIVDGTVGDNKVKLTISNSITADQLASSVITVRTLDSALVSDIAGNIVVSNTTVNVAK